jgi:hypothetical protein
MRPIWAKKGCFAVGLFLKTFRLFGRAELLERAGALAALLRLKLAPAQPQGGAAADRGELFIVNMLHRPMHDRRVELPPRPRCIGR